MILRLLESRRARRFAGGALAASVGIHLGLGSAAVGRPPDFARDGALDPISVRYLIPPNRPGPASVERIDWATLGAGATGAPDGVPTVDATLPKPRGARAAEAAGATEVPVVDRPEFEPSFTFQEYEVDSAATHDPTSGGPVYPDALREKGVQGEVLVEFAVDTTGHADSTTFVVVSATHVEFATAVREALPRMLFTPAVAQGRRVRQLVRLPMKFKLLTATASHAPTG
jgi:protein TonB